MKVIVAHLQQVLEWSTLVDRKTLKRSLGLMRSKVLMVGEDSVTQILRTLRDEFKMDNETLSLMNDYLRAEPYAYTDSADDFQDDWIDDSFSGDLEALTDDDNFLEMVRYRQNAVTTGESREEAWARILTPLLPLAVEVTITDAWITEAILSDKDFLKFWLSKLSAEFTGTLRFRSSWKTNSPWPRGFKTAEEITRRLKKAVVQAGYTGDIRLELFDRQPHNRWIALKLAGEKRELPIQLPHGMETFSSTTAKEVAKFTDAEPDSFRTNNSSSWSPKLNDLKLWIEIPGVGSAKIYLSSY